MATDWGGGRHGHQQGGIPYDGSRPVQTEVQTLEAVWTPRDQYPEPVQSDLEVVQSPRAFEDSGAKWHHNGMGGGAYTDATELPPPLTPTAGGPGSSSAAASAATVEAMEQRYRRRLFLLALLSVLVAVVAGVVGGIVGWKVTEARVPAAGGSSDDGNNSGTQGGVVCPAVPGSTDPSSETAPTAPSTIRANSPLAVAGWRLGDSADFQVRLFYQSDVDSKLQFVSFHTQYANWSSPAVVNIPPADAAMPGTPLAATSFWWALHIELGLPSAIQVQLFYVSATGKLLGYNWRDSYPLGGLVDSIDKENYLQAKDGGLAGLWPFLFSREDSAGAVYDVVVVNKTRDRLVALDDRVGSDSPLLALPVTPRPNQKEVRVFYRNRDGRLAVLQRGVQGEVVSGGTGVVHEAATLPASPASLAGFVWARTSSSSSGSAPSVNTVVLWQDDSSGEIRFVTQIGESSTDTTDWSEPRSDPVFAGADKPTAITCLGQGGWANSDGSAALTPLSARTDMNRCFFQAGGKGRVKQVWFDGTKWVDLGFVPIP